MPVKLIFAVSYLIPVIVLTLFLTFGDKRLDRKKDFITICFLCSTMVAPILCAIRLICHNEFWASIFMALYFASIDWMLLLFIRFISVYCSYNLRRYLPVNALLATAVIDSAMLLSSPFTELSFSVEAYYRYGSTFFNHIPAIPFNLHLLYSYVLAVIAIVPIIIKIKRTSNMYRPKYTTVLFSFLLILVVDGLYLIAKTTIDFSVIGYPIVAFLIYYFSKVYAPRKLLSTALGDTVDMMNDGVIIFDSDGATIFYNSLYVEYFKDELGEPTIEGFKEFCDSNLLDITKDIEYDWSFEKNGKTQYVKTFYKHLSDGKHETGSFINFQIRTREMEVYFAERHNATHDELTDIYNANHFYEQARIEIDAHPNEKYIIICSDIVNFKMINDIFGERAGDAILCDIANELRYNARYGDVYGRLNNDRFALLMRKKDYRESIFITRPYELLRIKGTNSSYPVSSYFGVYEIDDTSLSVNIMCDRAIMAINSIKGQINKRVAYYDDSLKLKIYREQELLNDITDAIANGDIKMYLQPQISSDGRVMGGEALVRWQHPKYGLLTPSQFLNLFEKNGQIAKIDMWLWEEAAKLIREWEEKGFNDRYISVNISPKDFFYMDVYKELTGIVKKYGVNPASINIEITEYAMFEQLKTSPDFFSRLSNAGFKIELDDFGAGNSSLNMLYEMRADVVKLDQRFMDKVKNDERGRKILDTVFSLVKDLNAEIILEGVETEEQLADYNRYKYDFVQGYYYDKPMPVSDFEDKYIIND